MNISNCEQKVDNINTLISHLLNDPEIAFFKKTNAIRPDFSNHELSFVRLVSWLYILYFESGKDSIKVIKNSMFRDSKKLFNANTKIVGNLRTKLHHNLDRTSSRSFKIEKDCHSWIKNACGKNIPSNELDWKQCSEKLINEADSALSVIMTELEAMTDSVAQKEIFIFNWKASKDKSVPPHIYDTIISDFIKIIHQTNINVVEYRKEHYETWNKYISLLAPESDYLSEAKRTVESSLIKDFVLYLPTTIETLSTSFNLSTDFIKDLLLVIYDNDLSTCTEEEAIQIMKEKLPKYSN